MHLTNHGVNICTVREGQKEKRENQKGFAAFCNVDLFLCFCVQVDAINFYMEEEAELMRACDEEREIAYRDPIGIAFITLQSDMQAQRWVLVCVNVKCVCVYVCVVSVCLCVCVCLCVIDHLYRVILCFRADSARSCLM